MIQRLESSFTGTLHHSEANNAVAADGHNGDGAVSVGQPSAEVESSLRQKLKEQEELLAEQDQRIRELEAAGDEKRSATLQRKKSKKKKHRAVSRAFIAGVWVAFFQRVPAMIVRTGPRERLGAGAEAEQPAAPQRSAAAQGGAHEHRLRRTESFGRSAAGAAKRARASSGATGAAGAAGELAGVRRVLKTLLNVISH